VRYLASVENLEEASMKRIVVAPILVFVAISLSNCKPVHDKGKRRIQRRLKSGRFLRVWPNQSMKPTRPLQKNLSEFATTPCRSFLIIPMFTEPEKAFLCMDLSRWTGTQNR
jgi:hypothetical protein